MKQRIPAIVGLAILVLYFVGNYMKQTPRTEIDYTAFGETPVHVNGRLQPLDSVARNSLLTIRYKRSFIDENDKKTPAIVWLTELMMSPEKAHDRPVFRITNDDVRSLLKLPNKPSKRSDLVVALIGPGSDHFYYSLNELQPSIETISEQAQKAGELEDAQRSRFQKAVIDLARSIQLYMGLSRSLHHAQLASFTEELEDMQSFAADGIAAVNARQMGQEYDENAFNKMMAIGFLYQNFEQTSRLLTVPTKDAQGEFEWQKNSSALTQIISQGEVSEIIKSYATIVDAYREGNATAFNEGVRALHADFNAIDPYLVSHAGVEQTFNFLDPFYICMVGYVMAFLAVIVSWIRWPERLNQAALWIIVFCAVLHTIGLGYRVYIIEYAPVINLYSSALFVGWGAVLLAIFLERFFKNSIGNATAAVIGFLTLLVAHHLSADGDTLEMLRAVLDNNFWLATHVIIITLGYSATFLAGCIGILFVLMSVFSNRMDRKSSRTMGTMVYGIICFATLFSFVGTILGGIWADQSWGRFWGWDPKENGALLIVIWNAIILHARWGGFARTRGIMLLSIFGNIVFSWSWFGTNMLGIGLHAYGFMDSAFFYLAMFVAANLLVIAIGATPLRHWKSQIQ